MTVCLTSLRFVRALGAGLLILFVAGATPRASAAAAAIDSDFDGVSDSGDAFPCDWRRTAVTFVPGEQDFATLMFEDNWPARGDLDFNDAVLLHNVALFHDASGRATGLRLTLVPRAIGANIASGVALRLPIPASSLGGIVRTVGAGSPTALTVLADETDLVVPVVTHLRDLFNGAVGFINTERALPAGGDGDVVTVELTFAQPVSLSLASDPFDVYFFRTDDPRHQIHRPQFSGTDTMRDELFGTADDGSTGARSFVDADGMPFVLSIPEQSIWPVERERVERLWPDLTTFAASGGASAQDFYATNVDLSKAFSAAASAAVPGLDYAACVAPSCTDGARNGVETDVDCGGGCGPCGVGGACRVHDDCGTGVCVAAACIQSDVRSCALSNGTGTESRSASGWAPCVASACDAGFHVEGGACASDVRECALVSGSGTQTWAGGAYGACVATRCDAGYRLSGGACVELTYAWTTTAWSTCSGATSAASYGSWSACSGGSGAWSSSAWGACSASAVCSGSGTQTRSNTCSFTASSGSQSRSASCDWDTNSGSQSRSVTCVNNFGETVAGSNCAGAQPSASQSCTPSVAPSCGTLVTSQACTPTDASVCGAQPSTSQSCSSPAGSQSCAIENGTGSQSCAAGGTAWSTCAPTSCNAGFHVESGACLPDTRSCSVTNGSGTQTWNGAGYGACTPTSCDAGYRLSGGACVQLAYAWSTGSWGTCSGGTTSASYGAWGTCSGGSGTWSSSAWGSCSASAVCSGSGTQTRTNTCNFTASSGSQSRTASCDWNANSGSQSRAVTCVNNFGETVASSNCVSAQPAASQSCTPATTASCGTLVTSQACTPTNTAVCGAAPATSQACTSPAGSQSCAIANGTGTQSCAASSTTWGTCTVASCNSGFTLVSGSCVANNPVPVLTALSPTSVGAGSGAFTLTLTGSSFVSGSVAYFGPTALTTTFVSSTQLTATVPASLVTTAGSANVTVVNPAPVGGTSGAVAFAITSGTSSSPGTSCNTIRSSGATANGTYWIDPDGAGGNAAFQVYCDMANASGGWTMILMSTAGTTFSWGSAYWTNATTLNPTTTDPTSNVDMKNLAFSTLGFSEMRFCLDTTTNCITVSRSAASAMAVFSAGAVSASVSRATFMSWDPTADSAYSNMPNCNASGFNQQCVYSRCRFGITLNNENDCGSCDATIGFGCEQVAGGAYNTSYSSGGANWNTPYRFRGFLFVR